MDTTRKNKGFFKSKLLPKSFSRPVTKHGSGGSRKVSPSMNTAQNMANYSSTLIPMVTSKQPTGYQQHKAVPYFRSPSFYDHNGYANETWGLGDENVDSMASTFISNVKERFKIDGEPSLCHG